MLKSRAVKYLTRQSKFYRDRIEAIQRMTVPNMQEIAGYREDLSVCDGLLALVEEHVTDPVKASTTEYQEFAAKKEENAHKRGPGRPRKVVDEGAGESV